MLDRGFEEQRDMARPVALLRQRVVRPQLGGERRRAGVEFGVADGAVAAHQGRRAGRTRDLPREAVRHRRTDQGHRLGAAGLGQRAAVRSRQLGRGRARPDGEQIQSAPEQTGHRLDFGGLEVVVGVLPQAVETIRVLDDGQCHRALRLGRCPPQGPGGAVRQRQRAEVGVLQDEQEVERRRPAGARLAVGQYIGQRHVLPVEDLPRTGAQAQQLAAQLLARCDGQRQQDGIGEHADTGLELPHRPVGHGTGDARTGQAGHPVQTPREDPEQQLKERQAQFGAEPVHGGTAYGVERGVQQPRPRGRPGAGRCQRFVRPDRLVQPGVVGAQPGALGQVGGAGEPLGLPGGVVERGGRPGSGRGYGTHRRRCVLAPESIGVPGRYIRQQHTE